MRHGSRRRSMVRRRRVNGPFGWAKGAGAMRRQRLRGRPQGAVAVPACGGGARRRPPRTPVAPAEARRDSGMRRLFAGRPPAKLRLRLDLARPSHQNEQGLMRPSLRPHCTIRPTAARLRGLSGWRRLCSRRRRALPHQRISPRMANTRSASAGVHCLPRCVRGRLLRGAKPRIPSLPKRPRQSWWVLRAKPSRDSDAASVTPCPRARSTHCGSSKRRAASGWPPRPTRALR